MHENTIYKLQRIGHGLSERDVGPPNEKGWYAIIGSKCIWPSFAAKRVAGGPLRCALGLAALSASQKRYIGSNLMSGATTHFSVRIPHSPPIVDACSNFHQNPKLTLCAAHALDLHSAQKHCRMFHFHIKPDSSFPSIFSSRLHHRQREQRTVNAHAQREPL